MRVASGRAVQSRCSEAFALGRKYIVATQIDGRLEELERGVFPDAEYLRKLSGLLLDAVTCVDSVERRILERTNAKSDAEITLELAARLGYFVQFVRQQVDYLQQSARLIEGSLADLVDIADGLHPDPAFDEYGRDLNDARLGWYQRVSAALGIESPLPGAFTKERS
jgi:hypothetical protein